MAPARRALITNDDGIASPGLDPLVAAARGAGLDVLVAAPSWDSSGASASLTAVEDEGRFMVHDCSRDGEDGVHWIGVEGAPAFIVRAAVTGAFGDPPDLILSGVNHGLNTGHAVLHSGTVGAVLTGWTLGVRGMAVSMDVGSSYQWDTAADVVRQLLPWLVDHTDTVALNLNLPNIAGDELKGVQMARLARFGAVQTTVTDRGHGWVRLGYEETSDALEEGTDACAVAHGYASLTALGGICEAPGADLSGLGELAAARSG